MYHINYIDVLHQYMYNNNYLDVLHQFWHCITAEEIQHYVELLHQICRFITRIYQRLRWNIILWGFVFINEKVMGFFPHFNPMTLRK
jgi:hypothetical protein